MRLSMTDKQREHLRRVRDEQLADWRAGRPQVVDELFITDDVVRLMSGVWVGNLAEGQLPWVLDDPKQVASCIVRWSGCVGLPELIDALPPAPVGAAICPLCRGSREMPDFVNDRDDGFRFYCQRCSGLGWVAIG
jgi:hypothetical protein